MSNRDSKNPWGPNNTLTQTNDKQKHAVQNRFKPGSKNSGNSTIPKKTDQKFLEAQSKHLESARKLIVDYESSSDEEIESGFLLDSVFKGYAGDKSELQKNQQFLENIFQSGAATCLICIASVKRTDSIWSCEYCYTFFHLACIQRWANDSTLMKKLHQDSEVGYYNNQGEYIVKERKVLKWNCPNCRHDYMINEIPRSYTCFCKNEINPPNHPWLVPHSCGEVCRKDLKPECGHKCVLLCHPGSCPPCPQMITTSCCCGESKPKGIRCSQKEWKCLNKCKHKLGCGIHTCGLLCHSRTDCPPCIKKSQQKCLCGNNVQERNCNDLIWQCEKICNKQLLCGLHRCDIKCHADDCGNCPLGLPRECPCGKEKTQAPCSEEIGPCGDTCQKLLSCELHICVERCHKGNCSQCLELTKKLCRCGLYSKELPCNKTYLCDTKCKQMRDCNKHACNRKCCENQCPPCDKICGKTLSCGKHKCTSLCHHGLCYPCTLKAPVKCRCGSTVIIVPCGREKKTKPPRCSQSCRIPSICHHKNPHRCHLNDCPICSQQCLLPNDTTNCEHLCQFQCHDAVKVSIVDKNFKPIGPWDRQPKKFEIQKLPHPPCEEKVLVNCIGGHETELWPCWNSQPTSCGRPCARKLNCGNHTCHQQCHEVSDILSKMQEDTCSECQEDCIFKRSNGCVHPCPKLCHFEKCDTCTVLIKVSCHCSLSQIYHKCGDFYLNGDVGEVDREKLQSCGNRCIKNYNCGHRCVNVCHSGLCPNPEACKKKIKLYCECKTRKTDVTCDKLRGGFMLICDETCNLRQEELKLAANESQRKEQEIEEEKNRLEMLEFEKKFAKKKYKERKRNIVEQKESNILKISIGIGLLVVCLSIGIYIIYTN